MARTRASAKQAGSRFEREIADCLAEHVDDRRCLHCAKPFNGNKPGRGGYQPRRKFCTTKCKDDHSNASRRIARDVTCPSCKHTRKLITNGIEGSMCRTCAAKIATTAAQKANTRDPLERFLGLTDRRNPDGCWHWTGHRQSNGYGAFYLAGRILRAHRWAYEHYVGPIPTGLQIDHLCRVRHCVNPDHLEPVTAAENTSRAQEANRGA